MASTWDVRLVAASYRREGPQEEPVVELFGRTRDGRSITVECWNFKPYFYVVEPPQSLRGAFGRDPEVIEQIPVELEVEGRRRSCMKVVLKHPWKTPDYRSKAKSYNAADVLAADIPFAHRFLYDHDLGTCFRVEGEETKGRYTTDLVVRATRFEPLDPFPPRLHILAFDIENSLKDGRLLCLGVAYREDGELRTACFSGSEREIAQRFVELVERYDPDVITGYNIDGYDLPVLLRRASAAGVGQLPLARDYLPLAHIGDRFWRLHGRLIADAWWSVKMELKPKQETLDHVARFLLGEGKHDVDRLRIDEEWAANAKRVMEYCVKDAELSLRVLEKVGRIEKGLDLAVVAKLPLEDAYNGRTSQLIDSILIRAADRAGVGVPMTRRERDAESIEGGYVHSLQAGLYEWVVTLDFRAMYPSLIIQNNICFTTQSDEGTIVSPAGVRFLSRDQKPGLLPAILEQLFRQREEIRAQMKREQEPERREYYRRLQDAVKVLMNAMYGVLASQFYRFTNPKIGGSITAFARENILGVIKQLEAEGVRVIYADTDSVFVESPAKDLEGAREFGKKLAERFSGGGITMEFERVLRTLFSHGKKKRYAAKGAWPNEGELLFRGYEIRRTDAFELQSQAQRRVFERILDNDIDGAVQLAREIVKAVQEGNVPIVDPETAPIEMLVISRSAKEDESYVNPNAMSNVQAARKLQEMGYEFVPGMKVSWIVTAAKKQPMEVVPYVSGRKFEEVPDWEYYARRLAQTLAYVTEVYGWDEKALLLGYQPPKQAKLFEEGFAEQAPQAKPPPDRPLTLEDFL